MFSSVTSYKSQCLTESPFECSIITFLHLLLNLAILQSFIYVYIYILRRCLWVNHMFWVLIPAFAFPLNDELIKRFVWRLMKCSSKCHILSLASHIHDTTRAYANGMRELMNNLNKSCEHSWVIWNKFQALYRIIKVMIDASGEIGIKVVTRKWWKHNKSSVTCKWLSLNNLWQVETTA